MAARSIPEKPVSEGTGRRLSKAARRQQLLDTARVIVREEGADRLTLGYLAVQAGVSKPVVYEHFGTRSGLLIELYRWLDLAQMDAFRQAMTARQQSAEEATAALAEGYIRCVTDMQGEVGVVAAALAGSEEKTAVYQELLEHGTQMVTAVLTPHSKRSTAELQVSCIGLVGAGEALAAAVVRGALGEREAIEAFTRLVRAVL
ncbi:AcrR family transcriptional regulator [Pseudomonas oryzihabitans]|uniref:TetR/AcrR family transcriptional regulator n=1 Tax=Pseudomonas flavocrustae TaxID=2991719 RepID=A0ABT6ILJ4_9PSED|nr:TetR/AcrR family transcriptional regulator [Pseudomonas sp. CBMAI 2609]MDH4765042.1 TetR/AcrR family transcriptional regulator [Pseudomonas sp. CBMAI 2609]